MIFTWHKAEGINASTLAENTLHEISVNERQVGLLKRGNDIYAFAALCPHAGAHLCEGWIDARGRIVCPLHGYRYDARNGHNTSGEGYKLRTYNVEVRDDEIFIAILP